tara:strand:+ start:3043 stop:4323 length:1281 start_codon:yes stop_codon:yes gene_type:complete
MQVNVTVASRPRVEKLLARLERAHDMRGASFSFSFSEPWVRKRQVGPNTYVGEHVCTLTVDMEELSDDWVLLFKNEPVDINADVLHGSDSIRKWNPNLSEKNWATEAIYGEFLDMCDHCDSGKRGRHATYTLQAKDGGDTKTVGSSCLYEYTSIDPADVEALLSLKGKGEHGYTGPRNRRTHPSMALSDFALLAGVWCNNGLDYQKGLGGMFFDEITYAQKRGEDHHDLGYTLPTPTGYKFVAVVEDVIGLSGEGYFCEGTVGFERAPAVHADRYMAYMSDLAGLNSFEQNVRNIAKAGVVTSKTANLAGGAISGYMRANRQEAQAQMRALQEANKPKSKWVGEVGKRQSFGECTVMFTRRLENQWGVTTLTRFTDASGNMLVWFRSGNHDDLKVAMKVNLTATVKKHDSYKEDEQTTITRGKVMA